MFERAYRVTALDSQRTALTANALNFSSIWDGNIAYAGSIVQVEESCSILVETADPAAIDVDLEYYQPNRYLGTYQIGIDTGEVVDGSPLYRFPGHNHPDVQGRILAGRMTLFRYTNYVIGDANGLQTLSQIGELNACNTATFGTQIGFGGVLLSVEDYLEKRSVFKTKAYQKPPTTEDRRFFGKLNAVGLYLKPGVVLQEADYKALVINVIQVSDFIYDEFTCQTLNPVNCSQQAIDYAASSPGFYLDKGECDMATGTDCVDATRFLSNECGDVGGWVARP